MESDRARNAICRLARSHVVDVPSSSRLRAGCDLIRVMLPASHSRWCGIPSAFCSCVASPTYVQHCWSRVCPVARAIVSWLQNPGRRWR